MKTTYAAITMHALSSRSTVINEVRMITKLAEDIDSRARSIKSSARAAAEFFNKVVEEIEETDLDSTPIDLDRQALRDLARDTVLIEAQKASFCEVFRVLVGKPFHKAAAEYKEERMKIYAAVKPKLEAQFGPVKS